jgi:hypothetical protein
MKAPSMKKLGFVTIVASALAAAAIGLAGSGSAQGPTFGDPNLPGPGDDLSTPAIANTIFYFGVG